jgi:hypothetical protein
MSKLPMRGHFGYLRFKTFPTTPRTPQCEVFCPLLSSSEHSGVPEDSKSQLFQVLGFSPTLGQVRVATPKLEYQNCPETVPVGVPGLWELITFDCRIRSQRGLNQSYSSPQEIFNVASHSGIGCREEVDSQLLVVGSQTASLTSALSFAYNLGWRCPNDQCEAILDIYVSRPFQWHQEHLNARCFGPCCRTLEIQESRRTPSSRLWECEFHPHTWPKWGCDIEAFYLTN